jgi:hypothetical protein
MSGFALVSILAALILLLALNRGLFSRLGAAGTVRLALIWAVVLLGGFFVLRLLGF